LQPITGILLALETGWSLAEGWIVVSIGLYFFIGICWLPVVWIQVQLRNEAQVSAEYEAPLSQRYSRLFSLWFILGIPAFVSILAIVWLMIARPSFW